MKALDNRRNKPKQMLPTELAFRCAPGSSSVLAHMRCGYTRESFDSPLQRARQIVPDVSLSTDVIVGFCGETEADHEAMWQLL